MLPRFPVLPPVLIATLLLTACATPPAGDDGTASATPATSDPSTGADDPAPPPSPWDDVTALWVSPLGTEQVGSVGADGPPLPYSVPADAAVFRDVLSRAALPDRAPKLRAGKLLRVEHRDGRREWLRVERGHAWVGRPDGRDGRIPVPADWQAWWDGVVEPLPDWASLTSLRVHDVPGSPWRELPAEGGVVRDARVFAEVLARARRLEIGEARPYTRQGELVFADGHRRRVSIGDDATTLFVEHGGTWEVAPDDRQQWSAAVVLPPTDWSDAVALRAHALSPFVTDDHPAHALPMADVHRDAGARLADLAPQLTWQRSMGPFPGGHLVVVELADGRRKALAVTRDGSDFREIGRQGRWLVPQAARDAWLALVTPGE